MDAAEMVDRGDGIRLATIRTEGRTPTVVFLPGLGSDMAGEKVTALSRFAAARGVATLRLDYTGHGRSEGAFTSGTIGRWRDDALHLIDTRTTGPLVLFGSSMGGWIAMLIALARPARVAAILGVAAAPDFTERGIWAALDDASRARLMAEGTIAVPGGPGGTFAVTRALIEDGRRHLLLDGVDRLPVACPVHLVEGGLDAVVPPGTAALLARRLPDRASVRITTVPDGDHRLSRPADIALLADALAVLLGTQDGA